MIFMFARTVQQAHGEPYFLREEGFPDEGSAEARRKSIPLDEFNIQSLRPANCNL